MSALAAASVSLVCIAIRFEVSWCNNVGRHWTVTEGHILMYNMLSLHPMQ